MRRLSLIVIFLGLGGGAMAQLSPGLYPISHVYTQDYGLSSQVLSLAQDTSGFVYLTTVTGVLRCSTEDCQSVSPKDLYFVYDADSRGRLMFSSQRDIQLMESSGTSELMFRSVFEGHDEDISTREILGLKEHDEQVYFFNDVELFEADLDFRSIGKSPMSGISGLSSAGGDLFLFGEPGFLVRRGSDFVPVPGAETLEGLRIVRVMEDADGKLVVLTYASGLYEQDETGFRKIASTGDSYLESGVAALTMLRSGQMAIGTRSGDILLMDLNGRASDHLAPSQGYPNWGIIDLMEDVDGGLWVGSDKGAYRIQVESAVTVFGPELGIDGVVHDFHFHADKVYARTMLGFVELRTDEAGHGRFIPTSDISVPSDAGSLLRTHDGWIVTKDEGLFKIADDGESTRIDTWQGQVYPAGKFFGQTLVQPAYPDRVNVYFEGAEGWTRTASFQVGEVLTVTRESDTVFWLGTRANGVVKGIINPADGTVDVIRQFGSETGLPVGEVGTQFLDGKLMVNSREGAFELARSPERDAFVKADRFRNRPDPENHTFLYHTLDRRNRLWMTTASSRLGLLELAPDGKREWSEIDIPFDLHAPIWAIAEDPDGHIWMGGPEFVIRHEGKVGGNGTFTAIISKLEVTRGDSLASLYVSERDKSISIEDYESGARLTFGTIGYTPGGETEYRYRLSGVSDEWSQWTASNSKEYTYLPPGENTFELEARRNGTLGKPVVITLDVKPPWYEQLAGQLLLAALGLLALLAVASGLAKYRTRRLQAENDRLEKRIDERTNLISQQKEQLARQFESSARTNVMLKDLNDRNNEFLRVAAHDLKNPLSNILGFASLVSDDWANGRLDPNELGTEVMPMIVNQSRQMLQIIESLLGSNADKAKINVVREVVRISDLIQEVTLWNTPAASEKSIEIEVPDSAVLANVDPTLVQRILDNLISNAIKYSNSGTVVTIDLATGSDTLSIGVRDSGLGISEEDQKKLFVADERLENRPTGGESSTGLGLYISRQLALAHGGTIEVETEIGTGSVFTLVLPDAVVESRRGSEPSNRTRSAAPGVQRPEAHSLAKTPKTVE